MEYRRLGQSGVRVSALGLGSWLTYGNSIASDTTKPIVKRAYELGINFFDTADVYNQGAAETVLGEILPEFPRSSYVLATKCYFPMGDGPNDRGLSRKHIFESCHASLKRLKTDYLDLYQCHRYDPETPLEETLLALDDLIRQGKILYAGVSEWSGTQISEAVQIQQRRNLHQLVSNQPVYNMLERYIEQEVLPVSKRYGLGQVVFSPLQQGVLTGKYAPGQPPPADSRAADEKANFFMPRVLQEERLNAVANLKPLAESLDLSMAQLALAWVLREPGISSAIIGASRVSQLEDNIKAVEVKLEAETLQKIDDILGPVLNPTRPRV